MSLNFLWGGDPGIAQTVAAIKSAIYKALRDPAQQIRRRAEYILRSRVVPERDQNMEIAMIGNFVKDHFHFVSDPTGLEYVKSPTVIDAEISNYNEFMGDCDDAAGYLAALLKSVGYETNLTVMANPRNPKQNFSHIYVQAFSPKLQKWISLDMTAKGKPLGWGPTSSRFRSYQL